MSATQNTNNLLDGEPFIIGEWEIDPSLGRVSGRDSISGTTKLEPQVMAVLLCLAQQPNLVVSREFNEELVLAGQEAV